MNPPWLDPVFCLTTWLRIWPLLKPVCVQSQFLYKSWLLYILTPSMDRCTPLCLTWYPMLEPKNPWSDWPLNLIPALPWHSQFIYICSQDITLDTFVYRNRCITQPILYVWVFGSIPRCLLLIPSWFLSQMKSFEVAENKAIQGHCFPSYLLTWNFNLKRTELKINH